MKKTYLFLIMFIIVGLLGTACGAEKPEDQTALWSPGLPSLKWGMSPKEVQQFYAFEGESIEISEHMYQYTLKDSVKLFDCRLKISLIFEETRGLERVEAYADQEKQLEKSLVNIYDEYCTGSFADDEKLEWKSEPVGSQYAEEQIRDAYRKVLGDIAEVESMTKAAAGCDMTRIVLYTSGEREGTLIIDGHGQNNAEWLLEQLKAE